jgi:tRNA A37 threonylcarbamoyladenosine modification protein TsaB
VPVAFAKTSAFAVASPVVVVAAFAAAAAAVAAVVEAAAVTVSEPSSRKPVYQQVLADFEIASETSRAVEVRSEIAWPYCVDWQTMLRLLL